MGLTLSRQEKESIMLFDANGRKVRVSVSEIWKDQVKLNIDAPDDVLIVRDEHATDWGDMVNIYAEINTAGGYQGASAMHTQFDEVFVGCGWDAEEAILDALDQAYDVGKGPHEAVDGYIRTKAAEEGRSLWVGRALAEADEGREMTDEEVEAWLDELDYDPEMYVYAELYL